MRYILRRVRVISVGRDGVVEGGLRGRGLLVELVERDMGSLGTSSWWGLCEDRGVGGGELDEGGCA